MWKAAELSCTLVLWWKQRLCTCQAASNLSPWRHLPYPVIETREKKLVRDIMEKKEVGWRQSSARFSPVYCSVRRMCWTYRKKKSREQLTELGVFHAQLCWLPRPCRYTQLGSRVLCIFSWVSWGNETYALVLGMRGCGYKSMCLSVHPSLSSRNSEAIDCFQPYLTEPR